MSQHQIGALIGILHFFGADSLGNVSLIVMERFLDALFEVKKMAPQGRHFLLQVCR